MNKELIDFHIKNGYFIKAQRTKTANGCFIEYPKSVMKNWMMEPFIGCYFAEDRMVKYYIEKEGQEGDSKELHVPNFAIRSIIAEDILLQTHRLNLSTDLILCYNKDGILYDNVYDLTQLIDAPESEIDRTREKILMEMVKYVIQGLDYSQQAQELEVYEGYKILEKICEKKGVCNI